VGVIPVGAGAALVLGDEVPMSTWVPSTFFVGGQILSAEVRIEGFWLRLHALDAPA
jgi:hypothetical protein